MKTKLLAAMLAATAVVAYAPAASAQTIYFGGTVSGAFSSTYNFALAPGEYLLTAVVSGSWLTNNPRAAFNFGGSSLNGQAFTFSDLNTPITGVGTLRLRTGVVGTSSLANNSLVIAGRTSGASNSYDGFLTIQALAPVPEPATWGIVFGGFAAMGVALRSRRRQERALAAA